MTTGASKPSNGGGPSTRDVICNGGAGAAAGWPFHFLFCFFSTSIPLGFLISLISV